MANIGRLASILDRFVPSTVGKLLLTASAWSFVLQAVSKTSVLISTLIGARLLGVEGFGLFVALQGVVFLSVSMWDMGMTPMMTRDTAAGDATVPMMLRSAFRTRTRLLLIPLAVLILGAYVLGVDGRDAFIATALFGLAVMANSASVVLTGALNASLRFRHATVANSLGRLGFVIAVIVVAIIQPRAPMIWLAFSFLIGEMFTSSALAVTLRREMGETWRNGNSNSDIYASFSRTLKRSSPYALSGLLILVYNRLDVAIVQTVAGGTSAGLYAPASRIQDAMLIFPMMATAALVPVAARQFKLDRNPDTVRRLLYYSLSLSLLLSLPTTLVVVLAAQPVTKVLLGGDFNGSIEPIRILALSIPFIAVGTPVMSTLTAIGRPHLATLMIALGFSVSVVGTIVLTPKWGAEGAAWAAMLREPAIALAGILLLFLSTRPSSKIARDVEQSEFGAR